MNITTETEIKIVRLLRDLKNLSKINDFLKNYKLAKLMPQAQKT